MEKRQTRLRVPLLPVSGCATYNGFQFFGCVACPILLSLHHGALKHPAPIVLQNPIVNVRGSGDNPIPTNHKGANRLAAP